MLAKSCPRCIGDMFREDNSEGQDWVCLQCGYRRDVGAKAGPINIQRMLVNGARLKWQLHDSRFDRSADADVGGARIQAA